jgi:hypothetical protein
VNHGRTSVPLLTAAVLLVAAVAGCTHTPLRPPAERSLELTDAFETLTGEQLWDVLIENEVKWSHGPLDARNCGSGNTDCRARFDMAYVMNGSQQIRPDPWAGTANGTIVGRIVNAGRENAFGVEVDAGSEFVYKAGHRGGKRHFIVIATTRNDVRQYWVREVTPDNQSTTALSSGEWINCQHTNGPKSVKSRFATCNAAHGSNGGSSTPTALRFERSPGWMECASSGCCTAGE